MIIVCVYCVVTIGDAKKYNFALASNTEENTFSVQSSKYISVPFIIRIGIRKYTEAHKMLKINQDIDYQRGLCVYGSTQENIDKDRSQIFSTKSLLATAQTLKTPPGNEHT